MGSLHAVSSLYFTRSGNVEFGTGSIRVLGHHGNYWSRTAAIEPNLTYILHINPATYPHFPDPFLRWYGFFTRCLAI